LAEVTLQQGETLENALRRFKRKVYVNLTQNSSISGWRYTGVTQSRSCRRQLSRGCLLL
jgi:hypothetical protein